MRNLIICTTPLQILIGQKITKLKVNEKFDVIVIAQNDNKKYQYYFNLIKQDCESSIYYPLTKRYSGLINFSKKLNSLNLDTDYKAVYLASIDFVYCHYILSRMNQPEIFTFDDGTANISKSSIYYSKSNSNIIKRFVKNTVYKILNINYCLQTIKDKSLLHYTIYENVPNIIDKTYFLQLNDNQIELNNRKRCEAKLSKAIIFLGQPFKEGLTSYNRKELIDLLETKLKIDFYFPHPRETNPPEGNFKIVNSDLILEDYIKIFLHNHYDTELHIYSFISSASLNLINYERVKAYYVYDPLLYKDNKDFYLMAKKYFNIGFITSD